MLGRGFLLQKEVSLALRHSQAQKQHNRVRKKIRLCRLEILVILLQCQTADEHRRRIKRLLYREKKKRKRLAEVGFKYDFPGYRSCVAKSDCVKKPYHVLFGLET